MVADRLGQTEREIKNAHPFPFGWKGNGCGLRLEHVIHLIADLLSSVADLIGSLLNTAFHRWAGHGIGSHCGGNGTNCDTCGHAGKNGGDFHIDSHSFCF